MPTDINSYLQLLQQFMPRQQQGISLGGLTSPQGLLGLGLLGGSFLGKEEPGYVTEARQNVRNVSSPQGYGNVFGQTVQGLQSQFQPLLNQQAEKGIADVSQRYKAAFPATVGMQGSQVAGLEKYLREELVPTQQAFLGSLGLQGINQQQQAATKIMELDRPDPFKQALAQLGGALMLGSGQNTGTFGGGGGFDLSSILGGGQQSNMLRPGQPTETGVLGQLQNSLGIGGVGGITNFQNLFQGGNALQSGLGLTSGLFGAGSTLSPAAGQAFMASLNGMVGAPIGAIEAGANGTGILLGQNGQVLGTLMPNGQVVSASGAQLGTAGGGAGGAGFLGTALGAAGTAAGGYFSGNLIGQQLPDSRLAATGAGIGGGAAAGALAGTMIFPVIGTAIGAAIGAIAGGIGGLTGSQKADHLFKAQRLVADQKASGNNVQQVGSFWTDALGAAGFQDLQGWGNFVSQQASKYQNPAESFSYGGVSGNLDQQDAISKVGSELLLKQMQQGAIMQGKQPPQSLNDVPGFRDAYVNHIMQNYQIEQGGSVSKIQNIGQAGNLLNVANLPVPGTPNTVATGEMVSQFFGNPDAPTRGEYDQLVGKIRAGGYNGTIPPKFYDTPGAIARGIADGLIKVAKGITDLTPDMIFKNSGIA